MSWLRQRSTGELLVLIVAGTVCGYVMVTGTVAIVLVFVHPEIDFSRLAGSLSDIINTLIGLMAGFLAGKSEKYFAKPPGDESEDLS